MRKYKNAFTATAILFLTGFLLIMLAAILNGENPFEIPAFSNLGVREAGDTFQLIKIQVGEALHPEVFNVALVIIGFTYIFLNSILYQAWEYKNHLTVKFSSVFGIIAGMSITLIAIFDLGTSAFGHYVWVGVLMLSATIQMILWMYATKDTKSPFADDFPFIAIVVTLWILAAFGFGIGFSVTFRSAIFKASLMAYFIYSVFVPIRLAVIKK